MSVYMALQGIVFCQFRVFCVCHGLQHGSRAFWMTTMGSNYWKIQKFCRDSGWFLGTICFTTHKVIHLSVPASRIEQDKILFCQTALNVQRLRRSNQAIWHHQTCHKISIICEKRSFKSLFLIKLIHTT